MEIKSLIGCHCVISVIYQLLIGHLSQGAGLLLAEVGDELLVLGLSIGIGSGAWSCIFIKVCIWKKTKSIENS